VEVNPEWDTVGPGLHAQMDHSSSGNEEAVAIFRNPSTQGREMRPENLLTSKGKKFREGQAMVGLCTHQVGEPPSVT